MREAGSSEYVANQIVQTHDKILHNISTIHSEH